MIRSFFWLLILSVSIYGCTQPKKEQQVEQQILNTEPELSPELEVTDSVRTEWQNPDLVISLLGDLQGETVLDVGAGAGYFTFKLANRAEKVIALDVDPNALEYIEEQKTILGSWTDNIEARLTPPDVPNLVDNEVDKALIVNTYAFLPDREEYLPRLLNGLKQGASLFIIDFKKGDIPVGPSDDFKIEPRIVRRELRAAGFRQIDIDEKKLSYQYIITAKKK